MKIYTKGGDKGVASLYNGERCPKSSAVFNALGDVDELNSILGMAREHVESLEGKIAQQVRAHISCLQCAFNKEYYRSSSCLIVQSGILLLLVYICKGHFNRK